MPACSCPPALLEPTAAFGYVPVLCGKQWDVAAYWKNAAGASNATAGPRITMPACLTCAASGSACFQANTLAIPCCDVNAQCVIMNRTSELCGTPPTNPTGPGAVVTDPTNTTALTVTLAPAASDGGLPFYRHRVVLTEVVPPGRRRLQAPVTLTKSSVSPSITFVADQTDDGEAGSPAGVQAGRQEGWLP